MPDSLHDIGREALLEITSADTIGAEAGQKDEGDGVVSVYFENLMTGYPGWHWTVSIASLEGESPSVLETELMPADGALLAPDWVPWSDRLADYKAAQDALGEAAADTASEETDSDADTDEDAEDETDDDADDLGSDIVHGGDVDGVDIDELDDVSDDDESDDDEDDDDDDDAVSDDELSDEDLEENEKTY